jgi:hypothetical protein
VADLFPYELVNVIDLRVERMGSQTDFGAESGTRTVVMQDQRAIVARSQDKIKVFSGESLRLAADIYLPPDAAVVLRGDRAIWSDFNGSVNEEEIVEITPWAFGPDDLFGVRLRVGQRETATLSVF